MLFPFRRKILTDAPLRGARGDWTSLIRTRREQEPVAHIFDVFCNGNALLRSFNPAAEARQTDVVIRRFTGLEPNAQGNCF